MNWSIEIQRGLRRSATSAVVGILTVLIVFLLCSLAPAAEFTAASRGDYGNVTVMEVSGNFDAKRSDGTVNSEPRQILAREFFRTHRDDYDFLVVFSNFDFVMPEEGVAFYLGVKNDVSGIGLESFDHSPEFGSAGRLQGTIDMGNLAKNVADPLDPRFEETLATLNHELLHRWGAYLKFRDASGNVSSALLGREGIHWSYLLDTQGSLHYGSRWHDNGNGTFTAQETRTYYSPLDLYVMGMIGKEQVPPLRLIENPALDPAKLPEIGATISGTARTITIDEIIAAEGERLPRPDQAQKQFKIAFIYATAPGTFSDRELPALENIRNGFLTRYSILTDGQGLVQVAATAKEELPTNPGVTTPADEPRTLPPSIDEGVVWLKGQQDSDGRWSDTAPTATRDTAEVLTALDLFAGTEAEVDRGAEWLAAAATANSDFLARKVESLIRAGKDASAFSAELVARQNRDGGWGSARNFASNPVDSALVLKALGESGATSPEISTKGMAYLIASQNADGGWAGPGPASQVQPTAHVVQALNHFRALEAHDAAIALGVAFLQQKQNSDGGFGNSPSTVYDSAAAVLALGEVGAASAATSRGVDYLLSRQDDNGSWGDSPFQTAMAMQAVYQTTVAPDLFVTSADISFIPEKIDKLPTNAVIRVEIHNLGRTGVNGVKIALYSGATDAADKIGEESVACAGQGTAVVTFAVPIVTGREHPFTVRVDPDNLIDEQSESNNRGTAILRLEPTYDFEMVATKLTATPASVDIFQNVTIAAELRNHGTVDAYDVPVRFSIVDGDKRFDLATRTVDIPANGTVTLDLVWRAARAGENLSLVAEVDPFAVFSELDESNNQAAQSLTVRGSTLPNLTVAYGDMRVEPNPALQSGAATIAGIVTNNGFAAVTDVLVNFHLGIPGNDGELLGSRVLPRLEAGESVPVGMEWLNITVPGTKLIYLAVDPDNRINEIDEADNTAFVTHKVLSLPDLLLAETSIAVQPSTPKEGDAVTLTVTVQNRGEQTAQGVTVSLLENGAIIDERTVVAIAGNDWAAVTFDYDGAGVAGSHELSVVVDPELQIAELSEENNRAVKRFAIQNADLWVSERYISPNGDGVQDSTTFGFRFEAPTTVNVVVVNEDGEDVRFFSGGALDNAGGGTVIWDGLNDQGILVPDGQYQMQLLAGNGGGMGSVLVVVDNNRTPFSKNLNPSKLISGRLAMEGKRLVYWTPRNEGFSILWDETGDHYYRRLANNESEAIPLFPMFPAQSHFSPDASGLFVIGKTSFWPYWWINYYSYSWYDVGTARSTSISGSYNYPTDLKFSPDGTKVAYWLQKGFFRPEAESFNVFDAKTGVTKKIIDNLIFNYNNGYKWSPDGQWLAYVSNDRELCITNLIETKKLAKISFYSLYNSFDWIDDKQLVYSSDANDKQYSIFNIQNSESTQIDDGRLISIGDKSILYLNDETHKVSVKNKNDNFKIAEFDYIENANKIAVSWSENTSKIALISTVTDPSSSSLPYDFYISILNVENGSQKTFNWKIPIGDTIESALWIDEQSLVLTKSLNYASTRKILFFNCVTGEAIEYDSPVGYQDKYVDSGSVVVLSQPISTSGGAIAGPFTRTVLKSPINLSAQLDLRRGSKNVILSGVAADLNFSGYRLEYSESTSLHGWKPITPPSDVQVINDTFATWIPPYRGSFYVRLTVWDKAGNTAWDRKLLSWGGAPSGITGINKNEDAISPNGDGVKDAVELHYQILDSIHLEFGIYDGNNRLVRTFLRDHAYSGEDFVRWDGRDEDGNVVLDGTYRIHVLDYDFFVLVDTAFPAVDIALSPLDPKDASVSLNGHAFDPYIKSWRVEYGVGENPVVWQELDLGQDALVATDENGSPQLDPIGDRLIRKIPPNELARFGGCKFRIVVEDSAGNISSSVSNIVEEQLLLYLWDAKTVTADLPVDLIRPGEHRIQGMESFRFPLNNLVAQYRTGTEWIDATAQITSETGIIDVSWDNGAVAQEFNAFRLRFVDIEGNAQYSNILETTANIFTVSAGCDGDLVAKNSLVEVPTRLDFQYKGAGTSEWTNFATYGAATGTSVPEGEIFLVPSALPSPATVRMLATSDSGKVYESNTVAFPRVCSDPVKVTLNVEHPRAECGATAQEAIVSGNITGAGFTDGILSLYLDSGNGPELLRKFYNVGSGTVSIPVANLPEGTYPLRALFGYRDLINGIHREAVATGTLLVDHTLPAARITYPAGSGFATCQMAVADQSGDWHGIAVEAVAQDDKRLNKYELWYGEGDNPAVWQPARTHRGGVIAPISGTGSAQGTIGIWDTAGLKGTLFALKLVAEDAAGNVSCSTATVTIDTTVEISEIATDKGLFSPNGDGRDDELTGSFAINEAARLAVDVYSLIKDGNKTSLGQTAERSILAAANHLAGPGAVVWNGLNNAGGVVSDGRYGLAVSATDSCGNVARRWTPVAVDVTSPQVAITYPAPAVPIGNVVEVIGTATDVLFSRYTLEAGKEEVPESWKVIAEQNVPVVSGLLGRWNSYGLEGVWSLRLVAVDMSGNESRISVSIDLGQRKTLIKNLDAAPKIFSPNGDGHLENTNVVYELSAAGNIVLDVVDSSGAVVNTQRFSATAAGAYSFLWDGMTAGGAAPDGSYQLRLSVASAADAGVSQSETVTVAIDSTSPNVAVSYPLENAYLSMADLSVTGSILDLHLAEYSVNIAGQTGSGILDSGSQVRNDYIFGHLNGLADGAYTLQVLGKDLAANMTEVTRSFTIDRTPPQVSLKSSPSAVSYGGTNDLVSISGSSHDLHLRNYTLRYGPGANPAVWTELMAVTATNPDAPVLFPWLVGQESGVADGLYTVSLLATDQGGLQGEVRLTMAIDNTAPEVTFASPSAHGYVRAPVEIRGTASDLNLDHAVIELSAGNCAEAAQWTVLAKLDGAVTNGILYRWDMLPKDGDYCWALSAVDQVGNRGAARLDVKLDTHPPQPPTLSGTREEQQDVQLTWTGGSEFDLAGYYLYRNGQKLTTVPLTASTFHDPGLAEGEYRYTVIAVDFAGNESLSSNEIWLKVDITPPLVKITAPRQDARLSDYVDITGTAYSTEDFREYRILIGQGAAPSSWSLLRKSPLPISAGVLGRWDLLGVAEGLHSLRLEAEDLSGNVAVQTISITLDNTPPEAPVLQSPIVAGSNVSLAWQGVTASDLAGYLLYRNYQLVNAAGVITGSVTPYLVANTNYSDLSAPDGKLDYQVVAVDAAGNMSEPSNLRTVELDTHPPSATITDPVNNSRVDREKGFVAKADSRDLDVASVRIQYKKNGAALWTDISSPLTVRPYELYIEPAVLGWDYEWYQLRAVATDVGGKSDPVPLVTWVTVVDDTPPAAPQGFSARVRSGDVTLTWEENREPDLARYKIYRKTGISSLMEVANGLLGQHSYLDANLGDGEYAYEIVATDTRGNESPVSAPVRVKVYTPDFAPASPATAEAAIAISGAGAEPEAMINIFNMAAIGPENIATTRADGVGNFFLPDVPLQIGDNRLSAQATDLAGNESKPSRIWTVGRSNLPSAPFGLRGSATGYAVNFAWDSNPGAEQVIGYTLFRDGEKINLSGATVTATASSVYAPYSPNLVLDGRVDTSWMNAVNYDLAPVWLELAFSKAELVRRIEIDRDPTVSGKTVELQSWDGNAWVCIDKVTENKQAVTTFNLPHPLVPNRLRIYISEFNNSLGRVTIKEIRLVKEPVLTATSYVDAGNLDDGEYGYQVAAINDYGLESPLSEILKIAVGDVTAPATPQGLAGSVHGSDVELSWSLSVNSEADLAGFDVFRQSADDWIKINSALVSGNTFVDAAVRNGVYLYRITAVDQRGNASEPSQSVAVTVSAPLPGPFLAAPTIPGQQISLFENMTTLAGIAEPGTNVELFHDGASLGTTRSSIQEAVVTQEIPSDGYGFTPSPTGRFIVYRNWQGNLCLKNMITGEVAIIAASGIDPQWSPDESKIAFLQYEPTTNIKIYNRYTDAVVSLNDNTNFYHSWSSDGKKLIFSSQGIWIKNFDTGAVINVAVESGLYKPKFSADGTNIAYKLNDNLFVRNLLNGETIQVNDVKTSSTGSYSWSKNANALTFMTKNSTGGPLPQAYSISAYDLGSKSRKEMAGVPQANSFFAMSPDGASVVYYSQYALNPGSILIVDMAGKVKVLKENVSGLSLLDWRPSGEIVVIDGDGMQTIFPEGYFSMEVRLNAGENIFYATAADDIGNRSPASEAISVSYDNSRLPDLSVSDDEIYLYPLYPDAGESVSARIVVRNESEIAANQVDVDVYLWDAAGALELVHEEHIPRLSGREERSFGFSLNAGATSGANSLIVLIDPSDQIDELAESNNNATRDFTVGAQGRVELDARLAGSQFAARQEVGIEVALGNSGPPQTLTLTVAVEDESGAVVDTLAIEERSLPYGPLQTLPYQWNTGAVFAGNYQIHVTARDDSGLVAETRLPFVILADVRITLGLNTSKAAFGANEPVALGATLKNAGANWILAPHVMKISVLDLSGGTELYAIEKRLTALWPGMQEGLNEAWFTGRLAPGAYQVRVEVSVAGAIVASTTTALAILADAAVSGEVDLGAAVVTFGQAVTAKYVVQNQGNTATSGIVRANLVDPRTLAVVEVAEERLTLGLDLPYRGTFIFPSAKLGLQAYQVALNFVGGNANKALGSAAFKVTDGVPPKITVQSPVADAVYNAECPLNVTVADDASGVETVEYQIDARNWAVLSPADVATGRYAVTWAPLVSDNGEHTIRFRGIDRAGNFTETSPLRFTIQTDSAPPFTETLIDGPNFVSSAGEIFVSGDTIFTLRATDDFSGIARTVYRVNGGDWQLYAAPFTLAGIPDGNHVIGFYSTDTLGNQEDERSLTVVSDSTPPATEIDFEPSPYATDAGTHYLTRETSVTLSAGDDRSGVQATYYRFNDEPEWQICSGALSLTDLAYGTHTLHYRSVDYLGNAEEEQRVTLSLIDVEVASELLNLPRVLVWTEDPERGGKAPAYTLATIRALLAEAFGDPEIYTTVITDKEEFRRLLRSGIYNVVMVIRQDIPLDIIFLREMREAVNRGTGLLVSHWSNSVPPLLQELFGADFKGALSLDAVERTLHLYGGPLGDEQTLTVSGRVLKTTLTDGLLAGIVPAESVCEGVRSLTLHAAVSAQSGDQITASLSRSEGKKLVAVDEEQLVVDALPTAAINRFTGNGSGDLAFVAVTDDGITLSLGAPYGYLEGSYHLALNIAHPDGSSIAIGPVNLTPTCSADLQAGIEFGPFRVVEVDEVRVKTGADLPAVILGRYGTGRTAFLTYDLIASALNGQRSAHLALLGKAAIYLLPAAVRPEAGGLSLLETRIRQHGSGFALQAVDALGEGLTHVPLFDLRQSPLRYTFHLEDGETAAWRYFVRFADRQGDFAKTTAVSLGLPSGEIPYAGYPASFNVEADAHTRLVQALAWVDEQIPLYPEKAAALQTIREELIRIDSLPRTTPAERDLVIHAVVQIIHQILQVGIGIDVSGVRRLLDDYLGIVAAEADFIP